MGAIAAADRDRRCRSRRALDQGEARVDAALRAVRLVGRMLGMHQQVEVAPQGPDTHCAAGNDGEGVVATINPGWRFLGCGLNDTLRQRPPAGRMKQPDDALLLRLKGGRQSIPRPVKGYIEALGDLAGMGSHHHDP